MKARDERFDRLQFDPTFHKTKHVKAKPVHDARFRTSTRPDAKHLLDKARGLYESESSESEEDEYNYDPKDLEQLDNEANVVDSDEDLIEPTKRLALVNLDWDHLTAADIFVLLQSALDRKKASGRLVRVVILPSEFGRERMEQEKLQGPAQDLILPDPSNEMEQLREYQLTRLRYYYCLAEFENVESAQFVLEYCQGSELEQSANVLELRYVPDDLDFTTEETLKRDDCTAVPEKYERPAFATDALRHSKVSLTWDEDDPRRKKLTRVKMDEEMTRKGEFGHLLASSEDDEDNLEARRSLLLTNPVGKKAEGIKVTFVPAIGAKQMEEAPVEETTREAYIRKQKEKKESKAIRRQERQMAEKDKQEPQKATKEELKLLTRPTDAVDHFNLKDILKAEKGKKRRQKKKSKVDEEEQEEREIQQGFELDLKDDRFSSVFSKPEFAIDPQHVQFHKTKNMQKLFTERQKRQRSE